MANGYLVRRLLALGAFDQGDHSVKECLARVRRNLHPNLIRQHAGPAGHGRTVATGLANHGCGFAGDG
jgi:hypothetical protein